MVDIVLSNNQFNIIALMCGHDASHDFFQKPPKGWAYKKSENLRGGARIGPKIKRHTLKTKRGPLKTKRGPLKTIDSHINRKKNNRIKQQLIKLNSQLEPNIIDEFKMKTELDDFPEKLQYIKNEINELCEEINIYDYIHKFETIEYNGNINESPLDPANIEESWIYDSDPEIEPEDDRRSRRSRRSRRNRSRSPSADRSKSRSRSRSRSPSVDRSKSRSRSPSVDRSKSRSRSRSRSTDGDDHKLGGALRTSMRSRTLPTQVLEKRKLLKQELEELWTQIEGWDNSVKAFLPTENDESGRLQMNNLMKQQGAKSCDLLTYKEFFNKQPGNPPIETDEGVKQFFLDFANRPYVGEIEKCLKANKDYQAFRKRYKTLNLERYVKTNWMVKFTPRAYSIEEDNRIKEAWVQNEYKRKGPILNNNQIDAIKKLHKALMNKWCNLIYQPQLPDIPAIPDSGWEKSLYLAMLDGNPGDADTKLWKAFTSYNNTSINLDRNVHGLLGITQEAYTRGVVVNNAAAMSVYSEGTAGGKQLFDTKTQYHCPLPSVIDPMSYCPKYTPSNAGKDPANKNTLIIKNGDSNSIKIEYSIDKQYFVKFTMELNGQNIEQTVNLDKNDLPKKLSIFETIKKIFEKLKSKLNGDENVFDYLSRIDVDNDIILDILKICTGKLCGDFSQELFAITNILSGVPIAFASNDRPSAIRFIYIIQCLYNAGILNPQQTEWWGGYLAAKNNFIISSTSENNRRSLLGQLRRKNKTRKKQKKKKHSKQRKKKKRTKQTNSKKKTKK